MKQKVTVIDLEGHNPSYRVETNRQYCSGIDTTYTCNVVRINGVDVETKGLSIEKESDFIEVVKISETIVNIKTSETGKLG